MMMRYVTNANINENMILGTVLFNSEFFGNVFEVETLPVNITKMIAVAKQRYRKDTTYRQIERQ